jgi:CHAT domain-containing protein
VGNVDFGSETSRWKPLEGTKREIDAIANLASAGERVIRLESQAATPEAFLKAAPNCRGIHLATHGFFHRAPAAEPVPISLAGTSLEDPRAGERNPLLRCGLAMAQANSTQPDAGVLVGERMLSANLTGVGLVVLSACETNVGVDSGGEGLFALQRAFQMAGARSVAASLWNVDDDATAVFMEEFYRELWKTGASKKDALRRAQLTLLKRYDPEAKRLRTDEDAKTLPRPLPMYWAAFNLSGDWH